MADLDQREIAMPNKLIYRRATPADLISICQLGNEVNQLHHEHFPQLFSAVNELDRDAAHWHSAITDGACFVAELAQESSIVGFISAQTGKETASMLQPQSFCRIATVGVNAAYRGLGIGTQLMKEVEQWATAQHCTEIRLNVFEFNQQAIALYQELGFAVRTMAMSKPLLHAD